MAAPYVRITGLDGALKRLEQQRNTLGQFTRWTASIQTELPYAYGIEVGHHRSGRLARKAGGAFYMKGAFEAVTGGGKVAERIVKAIDKGEDAGVLRRGLERDLTTEARRLVPVVSGRLRDSIKAGRTGE